MLEMLIYLYVFDLDICDIHLLRHCDRSELHHIIIIYQNNHVLELCLGSNYIYVCWRKRRTNCRDMPTKLAKKVLNIFLLLNFIFKAKRKPIITPNRS